MSADATVGLRYTRVVNRIVMPFPVRRQRRRRSRQLMPTSGGAAGGSLLTGILEILIANHSVERLRLLLFTFLQNRRLL